MPRNPDTRNPDAIAKTGVQRPSITLREALIDAASYWERRRLVYNGVLAVLVAFCWGADIVASQPGQWIGAALVLLVLGGLANLLYCAAYPVDLLLLLSPLHRQWRGCRWMLFAAGLLLASGLAVHVMLGVSTM